MMISSVPPNRSDEMAIDLHDLCLHRRSTASIATNADWIALLKVNHHRSSALFSDLGSPSFSTLDIRLHPSLARTSSHPEPGAWTEANVRSTVSACDVSRTKMAKSDRYKTELCRSFEETGFCKYKEKCQFAHGIDELKTLQRHPKYKTDQCRTYHSTGFCPYGSRCHFIHAEPPPPLPPSSTIAPAGSVLQCQQQQQLIAAAGMRGRSSCPREAEVDQRPGISREQLDQFLEAFSRALEAVASRPLSPDSLSSSVEVLARQDSVSSGSLRSTPDRAFMRDENRIPYTRVSSSCSNDGEVFSHRIQSPTSPSSLFGSNSSESSSSLSSCFWPRVCPGQMLSPF